MINSLWESRRISSGLAFATYNPDQNGAESGINLLKRAEEFQSKQAGIANYLLAKDLGSDRRRFVGY
jgi:hypothetical protein